MNDTPSVPARPAPDDTAPQLDAESIADLVALVPYLLGFRPADSMVALGITGGVAGFVARGDLPPPGRPASSVAEQVAQVVARQDVDGAVVCVYGPPERADPAAAALIAALTRRLVPVHDALRVAGHRYWSYLCDDTRCCLPEGREWDPAGPAVLTAIAAGRVALPDRAAMEARIAPVTDAASDAADRARPEARRWLVSAMRHGKAGNEALYTEAVRIVRAALAGGPAPPGVAALTKLALLVSFSVVRDAVLHEFRTVEPGSLVRLWTEVVRHADGQTTAGAATLLAHAAWSDGDGTLAGIAIRRALAHAPGDQLALDIAGALSTGLPPGAWPSVEECPLRWPTTDWCGLPPP